MLAGVFVFHNRPFGDGHHIRGGEMASKVGGVRMSFAGMTGPGGEWSEFRRGITPAARVYFRYFA